MTNKLIGMTPELAHTIATVDLRKASEAAWERERTEARDHGVDLEDMTAKDLYTLAFYSGWSGAVEALVKRLEQT